MHARRTVSNHKWLHPAPPSRFSRTLTTLGRVEEGRRAERSDPCRPGALAAHAREGAVACVRRLPRGCTFLAPEAQQGLAIGFRCIGHEQVACPLDGAQAGERGGCADKEDVELLWKLTNRTGKQPCKVVWQRDIILQHESVPQAPALPAATHVGGCRRWLR